MYYYRHISPKPTWFGSQFKPLIPKFPLVIHSGY